MQISDTLSKLKDPQIQVGVLLDHRYTVASFRSRGINALKGIDLDRYSLLKKANDLLPAEKKLTFFIVHGNYVIDSYDVTGWGMGGRGRTIDLSYNAGSDSDDSKNHSIEDECEWETNEESNFISECYDIDGKIIFGNQSSRYYSSSGSNMDFDSFTHMISPTMDKTKIDFNDLKVWGNMRDKKFEGWTGNEGATMTTIYHKYMLAFMPQLEAINLALKVDPQHTIKSFYESPKSVTKEYLKILLETVKKNSISKNSWFELLNVLIKFNDLKIAKEFLVAIGKLDLEYVPHLAQFIKHFGYELLLDSLVNMVNSNVLDINFNYSFSEVYFWKKRI